MSEETLLTVLVGSQAHGLASEHSDWDYRGVYVTPTREILSLGSRYKGSRWNEGGDQGDHTAYEIGHFLHLAVQSNPTVLEVFNAPLRWNTEQEKVQGARLQALFPAVWSTVRVRDAFLGYAQNQRKKMLDDQLPEERRRKFGVAWLRVLSQGIRLLRDGVMPVDMRGEDVYDDLVAVRDGHWSRGETVDAALGLMELLLLVHDNAEKKEPDQEGVNDYLLSVRAEHWRTVR